MRARYNREQKNRIYFASLAKHLTDILLLEDPTLYVGWDGLETPPYQRRIDFMGRSFVFLKPRTRKLSLDVELARAWRALRPNQSLPRSSDGVLISIDRRDQIPAVVEYLSGVLREVRQLQQDQGKGPIPRVDSDSGSGSHGAL